MSSRRQKHSRDTAGWKKSRWDPSVENTATFGPELSPEDYSISQGNDQPLDDLASFENLNLSPQQTSLTVVDPNVPDFPDIPVSSLALLESSC
jgi:hypothetical protein